MLIVYKCSVCGSCAVSIGYGDGDLLCDRCDGWRQESVDRERRVRAEIMASDEWKSAQMAAIAGCGKMMPLPRGIWP